MKKTALVIAPGRGTYNKAELGYLNRYHSNKQELFSRLDGYREKLGQTTLTDLDSAGSYLTAKHTRGDNSSALIYACAYSDFLSINRDEYEIIAVTGNSMGWYIALGCTGALSEDNSFSVVNTMGTYMQKSLIGKQLIYSLVDENWCYSQKQYDDLNIEINKIIVQQGFEIYNSINLGGMAVLGGNDRAIEALQKALPLVQDRFPFILPNHAAFHTKLQKLISEKAFDTFSKKIFKKPSMPMIDGRGYIWQTHSTDINKLYDYTLGHQVHHCYDFTKAIQVGVKEFSPDCLIVLGPGSTLGSAVAQSLIGIGWEGLWNKNDFLNRQQTNPILLSMGIEEQRRLVL